MRKNHEIDYFIKGEEMQYVEIELDPQETAIAEAGAFMYMDDGIKMETIFGDGSQEQQGFMSKLWKESLVQLLYYKIQMVLRH
jgi:uncharacterized protein (AIM24 family)